MISFFTINMSHHSDWIINDAYFGKLKDVSINNEAIKQFWTDVVIKHPNKNILMKNFSDIYVLVASVDTQTYLTHGEKTWKEIMNEQQYNMLEENKKLVIAYMITTEKDKDITWIDLIDTMVPKNNLGRVMISKYEKERKVTLIPQDIIYTSVKYWEKFLNIEYKKDIEDFIKSYKLNPNDLKWKHLYDLYK